MADGEPIRSSELRAMDAWDDPAHKAEVIATFKEGRALYQEQAAGTPDTERPLR